MVVGVRPGQQYDVVKEGDIKAASSLRVVWLHQVGSGLTKSSAFILILK